MKNFFKIILIVGFIIGTGYKASALSTTPLVKTGYYINKNFDLIPNDKNTNKKVILITIDDGPGKTDKDLIAILNKHNAKAIFFINGIHDKTNPGNIKMLFDAGFAIGNHTWSHPNLKKTKNETVKKEINDNTELIAKITGENPKFFRPPFGISTPYAKDLIKKDGMIFMNWSGAAKDWEKNAKDKKVFTKNVMGNLHNGEILLLHGHLWTVKYLDDLLTAIELKGYTFVDPNQITN